MGAEAIKELLQAIDLDEEAQEDLRANKNLGVYKVRSMRTSWESAGEKRLWAVLL